MSKLTKALTAAAGNAGGDPLYVEDVFSTYLYTANNSAQGDGNTQTINNGLDLSGEGGLVWIKKRGDDARSHVLMDTERGATKALSSNTTSAERTDYTGTDGSGTGAAFTSTGFTVGDRQEVNAGSGDDFCSWTFRKAEKFFDIVTYTGNGVDNRQIPHNLGSVPGMIIVKATSSGDQWPVYHQSLGTGAVRLNLTNSYNSADLWWKTTPTDSHFTVYGGGEVNVSSIEYVAYLFASDAGGFGDDGSESIIKCGSYTGTSSNLEVNCGFEAQWVLVKNTTVSSDWYLIDIMRGTPLSGYGVYLNPNSSSAENDLTAPVLVPTATGFFVGAGLGLAVNYDSHNFIYIAIRRPMKTPESGTEVFSPVATTSATNTKITTGFPVDWQIIKDSRPGSNAPYAMTRLTSVSTVGTDQNGRYLRTNSDAAEAVSNITRGWDNTGYKLAGAFGGNDSIYWNFKRATGFFDVVAYTGTGTPNNGYRDVDHNLAVQPEMIILKRRDTTSAWTVNHKGYGAGYLYLTNSWDDYPVNGFTHNDAFTTTTFSAKAQSEWNFNVSGATYIAYLFATLAGVSKVGSYTGTGADLNVDCGFSAGARFILIKRADSTGDWYVYDSARGIVAGNDPYLLLNSTDAEVTGTDYIDPLSSGFTVTSSAPAALNASGGTYIFLAIA
jgi:hypothetical protein